MEPIDVKPRETCCLNYSKISHFGRGAAWLRRLRPEIRNQILQESAQAAAEEYRSDAKLTAFEAFAERDLYDETP